MLAAGAILAGLAVAPAIAQQPSGEQMETEPIETEAAETEAAETEAAEAEAAEPATEEGATEEEAIEVDPREVPPLPSFAEIEAPTVMVLPIQGTIELGLSAFALRAIAEAEESNATAIVLDVDTFGGRVDAAVQVRDALLATQIPTIAFVNRRAISAGALISLAADTIVFTPGGSMGAATPIQLNGGEAEAVGEKMVSYMRAEMRATAEANGRDGDLAEAMVDARIVVDGVVDDTRLLTVSTKLAGTLGLSSGVFENLGEVLDAVGLADAQKVSSSENWAESIARWLTDPTVSGILMSLGMLGIMVELYSPGIGLAGFVGVSCLVAFFGGHAVVNLVGFEELMLFVLGLVLFAAEVFVIPGFGVAGVMGIVLVFTSLALSLTALPFAVSWELGLFEDAASRVFWAVLLSLIGLALLIRFLPERALPSWLVLRTRLGEGKAPGGPDENDYHSTRVRNDLVGAHGIANTDLRLSGKARIGDEVVDVVSASEYISQGTPIMVLQVEGVRVVVVRAEHTSQT